MLVTKGMFERLCKAREILSRTDDPQPSIRAIAWQVGISPFHFIRRFEAVFGVTPHQYRINERLDRARRLLAQGRLSVTDVCMEVGLTSLGSFSEMFVRRLGTRPSEFRRRMLTFVRLPGELPARMTPGCLSLMAMTPDPKNAISEKQDSPVAS